MANKNKFFDKVWWKDFLVAILATTVSIILTFGTASLVDRIKQKKERRLTALMVMSNIESFARNMEVVEKDLAHIDSIDVWFYQLPVDDLETIGDALLAEPLSYAFLVPIFNHDKTAETIFSSQMDTWKSLGNFQFIDNVGECFSTMNWIEQYYNEQMLEYSDALKRISDHPDNYTGKIMVEKALRDETLRNQLLQPHNIRIWLKYCVAVLRQIDSLLLQSGNVPH